MRIGVFGGGFVGITLTAHLLKSSGVEVTVVDTNPEKLNRLRNRDFMVFEPKLDEILIQGINTSRLRFEDSASDFDAVFICIGTPREKTYKQQVESMVSVAKTVAKSLKNSGLILLRSTVPVGTTSEVKKQLVNNGFTNISVCFAPERTAEGVALEELMNLPQIIGAETNEESIVAIDFLELLGFKVVTCSNTKSAEMAKLVCNTWRDTTFAFANEIALLCEEMGISAREVIQSANQDYPRANVPRPGPVGGPCLSKDAYILLSGFPNHDTSLVRTARTVNENIVKRVFFSILSQFANESMVSVQFIGASFKGNPFTNDVRKGVVEEFVDLQRRHNSKNFKINLWDKSLQGADLLFFEEFVEEAGPEISPDVVIFGNDSEWVKSITVARYMQSLHSNTLVFDLWGISKSFGPLKCRTHVLGG
jgi:UDP-N-acetyl-D-mannosaminuronic acid dehydrogenase